MYASLRNVIALEEFILKKKMMFLNNLLAIPEDV